MTCQSITITKRSNLKNNIQFTFIWPNNKIAINNRDIVASCCFFLNTLSVQQRDFFHTVLITFFSLNQIQWNTDAQSFISKSIVLRWFNTVNFCDKIAPPRYRFWSFGVADSRAFFCYFQNRVTIFVSWSRRVYRNCQTR